MRAQTITTVYATLLLVVLGLIVVHAPLTVWIGSWWPDGALFIKAWKEIILVMAAVLAVIVISQQKLWRRLLDDWVIRLALIYSLLHVVLLVWQPQGSVAALSGLMIDLRLVVYFVLVYVLFVATTRYHSIFTLTAIAGAVVVIGFGVLQLFLPADILKHIGYSTDTIAPYLTVDKNHDYIRINSTLRGPNPLGAYAGMVLAGVAAIVATMRVKLTERRTALLLGVLAIGAVIVLWVSYSRSALVAAAIALAAVAALTILRRIPRSAWIALCVVVFAVAGGLIAFRDSSFVSNVILHENPEGGSAVSSNDGHVESLVDGTKRLLKQPLGAGIGSTGSASLHGNEPAIIENQYLFIAHESGWLGLLLFLALFNLVMVRLFTTRRDWLSLALFASGIGLAAIGLLLPVWVDDTVSLVWWGLAGMVLGMHNKRHDKHDASHKKATRTT